MHTYKKKWDNKHLERKELKQAISKLRVMTNLWTIAIQNNKGVEEAKVKMDEAQAELDALQGKYDIRGFKK